MTLAGLTAMLHAAVDEEARAHALERIVAAPVATMADIRAKVAALAWLRGPEVMARTTTDERIINSLVRDLVVAASPQGL
jgi:hypothetical protein